MSRSIVLVLTLAEAKMLDWLAGDLLIDPAELRARLGAREYAVAVRAANKLGAALQIARSAQTKRKE